MGINLLLASTRQEMTKYEVTTKITSVTDGLGPTGMPLRDALKYIPQQDAVVEEVGDNGQLLLNEQVQKVEEEVLMDSKVEQLIIQTITKWKKNKQKYVHIHIEIISIFEIKTQKNNFFFMKVDEF
jgi:hypothetical protein